MTKARAALRARARLGLRSPALSSPTLKLTHIAVAQENVGAECRDSGSCAEASTALRKKKKANAGRDQADDEKHDTIQPVKLGQEDGDAWRENQAHQPKGAPQDLHRDARRNETRDLRPDASEHERHHGSSDLPFGSSLYAHQGWLTYPGSGMRQNCGDQSAVTQPSGEKNSRATISWSVIWT